MMLRSKNVEQDEMAFYVLLPVSVVSALVGFTSLWHTVSSMAQKLIFEVSVLIGVSVPPLY
jgi:hypothetical protein